MNVTHSTRSQRSTYRTHWTQEQINGKMEEDAENTDNTPTIRASRSREKYTKTVEKHQSAQNQEQRKPYEIGTVRSAHQNTEGHTLECFGVLGCGCPDGESQHDPRYQNAVWSSSATVAIEHPLSTSIHHLPQIYMGLS
jgi:hypothetical protein